MTFSKNMRFPLRPIIALLLPIIFYGCANVPSHPKALSEASQVNEKSVVLLLSITGPQAVNYVQIRHSLIPCINFDLPSLSNDIVALPIPIGLKKVQPICFTVAGRPGYTLVVGSAWTEVGYRKITAQPVDLPNAGVYYLGVLDTTAKEPTLQPPGESDIQKARRKYGALLGNSQTLNFRW